jgi:hypothetical protein
MEAPVVRRLWLILAASLFAGACGLVGGSAPSPTPSVRDQAVAAWTNAVGCARDHGWNIPDPVIDDQGNATFPADIGKPPDEVLTACQHFLDALPNQPPNTDGPTADDIRMGRQFAACMRQNGMPSWPDPNADGTFPVTPEIQAEGKSPLLLGAMQACDQYHPSGRLFFSQPNSGG